MKPVQYDNANVCNNLYVCSAGIYSVQIRSNICHYYALNNSNEKSSLPI